jgi:siroheme synthase-like protein
MTVTERGTRPSLSGYPVNMLVRDRRVVVVGAGRIAARKIEPLLEAGALVEVIAPEANDEVQGWADAGRLVLHRRPFAPADVDGAWLALTATDDPGVNGAVHEAAEAARVWVNSADDPANCSFTLMSVIRRGDLVVSVGTGGRSPALATYLRRRLGEEIGPEYETLVGLLSEAREALRGTGRSSEDANWQSVFESGIVELVRTGRIDEARELLRTCLSSSSD